ncbi:MAG: immunoglobulin domain-containing protein [Chitinivibrionales bacterium]|nr:immunoglobulin domain-containing protein [Chitinivibrionales bacterium]
MRNLCHFMRILQRYLSFSVVGSIIPFALLCTDPIDPDADKSADVSISIILPLKTNGLGFTVGEPYTITATVKMPRFVDSLIVDFGEPENSSNIQIKRDLDQNVNSANYPFLLQYQTTGVKKIRAIVSVRGSNKKIVCEKEVIIGLPPVFLNKKQIQFVPHPLIANKPCTLWVELKSSVEQINFRWFKNYELQKELTIEKISFPQLLKEHEGIYICIANNQFGSDTSAPFSLSAQLGPVITLQPKNQQAIVGKKAVFTCQGSPADVNYQWYRNGLMIDSAQGTEFKIENVTLQDNGVKFNCRVFDAFGDAWSSDAILSVFETEQVPQILKHPANLTVSTGQKAQFSIEANGTTLIYQWQRNAVDIPIANLSVYEIPAVTVADNAAKFRCIISNNVGAQMSDEATLTVTTTDPQKPQITMEPKDVEVKEGANALFSVTAIGNNLRYQWKRSGIAISGATLPQFSLPIVKKEDNGVKFRCAVSNQGGTVESREATLIVKNDPPTKPVILKQPQNVEVTEGAEAIFTIEASGIDLKYQWKRNNLDIPGAIAPLYKLIAKKDDTNAQFTCVVSNAAGSVESTVALLKVTEIIEKPVITKNPQSIEVFKGEQAIFVVEATGTNLRYQWKRNESFLTSDTTAVLTIKSAAKEDNNATFTCVVKNSAGETISSGAKLTIKNRPPHMEFSTDITNGSTILVDEDELFSFSVTAEDEDIGDKVTLKSENLPSGAIFNVNGITAQFSYRPDFSVSKKNDEKQFSNIRFIAEDGDTAKETVSITIKVANTNRKPIYSGTSVTVQETQPGAIDISATDPDEEQLSWRIGTTSQNGTFSATSGTISASTECSFTSKNLVSTVTENIRVIISDGTDEVSGTLSITINSQNEKPKITSVTPVTCQEDQRSGQVLIYGEDPEGKRIYYGSVKQQPTKGTFDPGTGFYTPKPNLNGTDNFILTIKDEQGLESDPASVPVTIQPVNDAPVITGTIESQQIKQGEQFKDITLTATDVDGDNLTWSSEGASSITVSIASTSATAAKASLKLTDPLWSGSERISFIVSDGKLSVKSQPVTFTVAKNLAPQGTVPDTSVQKSSPVTLSLATYFKDPENDKLAFSLVALDNTDKVTITAGGASGEYTITFGDNTGPVRFHATVEDTYKNSTGCDFTITWK